MQDLLFFIHLGFLGLAAIGVVMADKAAVAWMRSRQQVVSHRTLFVSHWIVTTGLAGLILSGLLLFWPMRTYLLGQSLFWIKMAFVFALVVNSFAIEYLMHTAARTPWKALTVKQKMPLVVSGAVSTLSWLGAGITALVLFF